MSWSHYRNWKDFIEVMLRK
ncbi:protein YpfM [Escherichia coli]|nr:protein YpfM [Escherichia coli]QPE28328.1 protein YpfM [Escherichia coli]QPE32895.1 protein YpfM [Escherichia coli]QPE37466.1 protein YpfM [Escherichia coli]QPE42051.1 protein YpfM [Escherichia coli]